MGRLLGLDEVMGVGSHVKRRGGDKNCLPVLPSPSAKTQRKEDHLQVTRRALNGNLIILIPKLDALVSRLSKHPSIAKGT